MTPSADRETLLASVKLDAQGLVPVIAQEADTGMVRMMAWANRQALEATLATGLAHFWSRSRAALWKKGESSGNTLAVTELRLDCDGDVVLPVTPARPRAFIERPAAARWPPAAAARWPRMTVPPILRR